MSCSCSSAEQKNMMGILPYEEQVEVDQEEES